MNSVARASSAPQPQPPETSNLLEVKSISFHKNATFSNHHPTGVLVSKAILPVADGDGSTSASESTFSTTESETTTTVETESEGSAVETESEGSAVKQIESIGSEYDKVILPPVIIRAEEDEAAPQPLQKAERKETEENESVAAYSCCLLLGSLVFGAQSSENLDANPGDQVSEANTAKLDETVDSPTDEVRESRGEKDRQEAETADANHTSFSTQKSGEKDEVEARVSSVSVVQADNGSEKRTLSEQIEEKASPTSHEDVTDKEAPTLDGEEHAEPGTSSLSVDAGAYEVMMRKISKAKLVDAKDDAATLENERDKETKLVPHAEASDMSNEDEVKDGTQTPSYPQEQTQDLISEIANETKDETATKSETHQEQPRNETETLKTLEAQEQPKDEAETCVNAQAQEDLFCCATVFTELWVESRPTQSSGTEQRDIGGIAKENATESENLIDDEHMAALRETASMAWQTVVTGSQSAANDIVSSVSSFVALAQDAATGNEPGNETSTDSPAKEEPPKAKTKVTAAKEKIAKLQKRFSRRQKKNVAVRGRSPPGPPKRSITVESRDEEDIEVSFDRTGNSEERDKAAPVERRKRLLSGFKKLTKSFVQTNQKESSSAPRIQKTFSQGSVVQQSLSTEVAPRSSELAKPDDPVVISHQNNLFKAHVQPTTIVLDDVEDPDITELVLEKGEEDLSEAQESQMNKNETETQSTNNKLRFPSKAAHSSLKAVRKQTTQAAHSSLKAVRKQTSQAALSVRKQTSQAAHSVRKQTTHLLTSLRTKHNDDETTEIPAQLAAEQEGVMDGTEPIHSFCTDASESTQNRRSSKLDSLVRQIHLSPP